MSCMTGTYTYLNMCKDATLMHLTSLTMVELMDLMLLQKCSRYLCFLILFFAGTIVVFWQFIEHQTETMHESIQICNSRRVTNCWISWKHDISWFALLAFLWLVTSLWFFRETFLQVTLWAAKPPKKDFCLLDSFCDRACGVDQNNCWLWLQFYK